VFETGIHKGDRPVGAARVRRPRRHVRRRRGRQDGYRDGAYSCHGRAPSEPRSRCSGRPR
jgi:hypothetical protein